MTKLQFIKEMARELSKRGYGSLTEISRGVAKNHKANPYWNGGKEYNVNGEVGARVMAIVKRHRKFKKWMNDGRHEWEFVGEVYYADNSIEHKFKSTLDGSTKQVMALGPGGDAC